jgi:hypothetical protein
MRKKNKVVVEEKKKMMRWVVCLTEVSYYF